MGMIIYKICLIIANAICLVVTDDNKIIKFLNVLAIVLLSISFLAR